MTFKEQIASDNQNIFLNTEEFADVHVINGVSMPCQIDSNELIEREKHVNYRQGMYGDGVYIKELLLYVRADDFGALPAVGRSLTLDRKTYIITDTVEEYGIYSLTLEANRA